MLKKYFVFATFLALTAGSTLLDVGMADGAYHWTPPKPGQRICNSAFPGSLKVCHPVGSSPAGVVNLKDGLQFVVLSPFSGWKGLNAGANPIIAVFSDGKPVSHDTHVHYFENVQSVQVKQVPGGYDILVHAYKGGNTPNQYFAFTIRVSSSGKIAVKP